MADVAELIENIFVAHAEKIEAVKTVLNYEPDQVDRAMMPMICMFHLLPESVVAGTPKNGEIATGPFEDVDYRWEISLYISLVGFKEAQAEMRALAGLVIANFREHRSEYDLATTGDFYSRALRRRNPPTPDEDNAYLRASWELQVTAGEGELPD